MAIEIAGVFRLAAPEATAIVREVGAATATWRDVADRHGAAATEIERLARAFEHDQADAARAI